MVEPEPVTEEKPLLKRGDILEGTVLSIDEEGLLVDLADAGDVSQQQAFVPAHDLDKLSASRRESLQAGKSVRVYVMNPADDHGRLVVSIHQAVLNQKWLEAERLLESGEIWEGKVVGYNQGGVIVPFGRLRGFVPISHLMDIPRRSSAGVIRERLGNYVGRTLPLRVIEVDRRRRRLLLSHRKAYSAWRERQRQEFIESLKVGEIRAGRVRDLQDFGAFVDLGGGDGLIHISELAWHRVDHPKDVLRVGQEVKVYVLRVNRKRKRVALSLRRLLPHPWENVEERYPRDQLVEGTITRITDFGAFVELEPGVEGLLHSRHLPWAAGNDPGKVINEGETHLLRVISVEQDRRRIGLSMRAVTQDEQMEWMARRAQTMEDEIIGLDDLTDEEE